MPSLDWVTIVSTFFAATFGAISGAVAAFKLEQKRREREQINEQVADGNRTLLDLLGIWNSLSNYKQQVVDEIAENIPENGYWFALPSTLIPYSEDTLLDPSRYEFLLGTGGADIAARLRIERDRYALFLWLVQERSRILREFARPKWEAAGFGLGGEFSHQQIIDITGPNIYAELRDMTGSILKFLPKDIDSSRALFRELRDYLESAFPDVTIIDVELEVAAPPEQNEADQ